MRRAGISASNTPATHHADAAQKHLMQSLVLALAASGWVAMYVLASAYIQWACPPGADNPNCAAPSQGGGELGAGLVLLTHSCTTNIHMTHFVCNATLFCLRLARAYTEHVVVLCKRARGKGGAAEIREAAWESIKRVFTREWGALRARALLPHYWLLSLVAESKDDAGVAFAFLVLVAAMLVVQDGREALAALDSGTTRWLKKCVRSVEEKHRWGSAFAKDTGLEFYECPITHEKLKDPVIGSDGYTYSRAAIERWLRDGGGTSPMTRQLMHVVGPNRAMATMLRKWRKRNRGNRAD